MVTFFPTPYLRETLYGVISRFHVWSGNVNSKTTLRDLFNTVSVTAGRELPANINSLLSNLPGNCRLTVEDIITNHTLYNYYTAFLPKERAKHVYDLMSGGRGDLIFTSLGMCNNTVKIDSSLKYCKFCVESDRTKYGEAFWHLEHQLKGSLMCNKHFSELLICNKSIDLKNRQEYINLEMNISGEDKILIMLNENIIEHQKIFHKNADSIMIENFKSKEMNFFREYYLKKLIDKGMAESRTNIYQQDLLRDFKNYYGEEYLKLLDCNFNFGNSYNWVTTIVRKHRKSFQSIQHLLMIEYLDINIKDLFNSDYMEEKKGKSYIEKTEEEKVAYREKWLNLKKNYPNKSKSFIKDIAVATYTWLNRHDKRWLNENSPKRKVGIRKKSIINWEKRDSEFLSLVIEQVKLIKENKEKPERITVGLIGMKLKKYTLLQKRIDKMPNTKEYLIKNAETVGEFQIRRIKWAVKKLDKEGDVKVWKIVKLTGLSKERAVELKETILYYMNEC